MAKMTDLFALSTSDAEGATLAVVLANRAGTGGIHAAIRMHACVPFSLAVVPVEDWNRLLTPWPAPGLRDTEPFAGEGDAYLAQLEGEILPAILERLPSPPSRIVLAGYSLAGLFAVWALFKTTRFDRVAAGSASLWYPGFADFARENAPMVVPDVMAMSVGRKELGSRLPMLSALGDGTAAVVERFRELGATVDFEVNPGGHFDDVTGRMGRIIAKVL